MQPTPDGGRSGQTARANRRRNRTPPPAAPPRRRPLRRIDNPLQMLARTLARDMHAHEGLRSADSPPVHRQHALLTGAVAIRTDQCMSVPTARSCASRISARWASIRSRDVGGKLRAPDQTAGEVVRWGWKTRGHEEPPDLTGKCLRESRSRAAEHPSWATAPGKQPTEVGYTPADPRCQTSRQHRDGPRPPAGEVFSARGRGGARARRAGRLHGAGVASCARRTPRDGTRTCWRPCRVRRTRHASRRHAVGPRLRS